MARECHAWAGRDRRHLFPEGPVLFAVIRNPKVHAPEQLATSPPEDGRLLAMTEVSYTARPSKSTSASHNSLAIRHYNGKQKRHAGGRAA
jgi:hypothetical protein